MPQPGNNSSTVGRRALIAGAGLALAAPAVRAQGTSGGVALVIGNSKYHWEAPLPNVKRDAPDVARAFQSYGLKTELIQDAGRSAMNRAFENFGTAAKGANIAAFYFAGHGASWGTDSYLVPVDADLGNPTSTIGTLTKTQVVSQAMREAANRLLVFDNCRNNPADGWRQLEAEREAATGFGGTGPAAPARSGHGLALYSTAPGRIARDGPAGENSPFAAALLRQLQSDSVDLHTLPSKLRRDLLIVTEGKQLVWDRTRIQQSVVLNAPRNRQPVAVGSVAGNPARIVELPKAYAYAQEHGLPLPPGLIAYRAPANARDARKIGSFHFLNRNELGESQAILIVISVEEQQTAEIIMSVKGRFNPETKKMEAGSIWRFVTGRLSGDRMEYVPRAGSARWVFDWRDANAPTFNLVSDEQVGARGWIHNARLTRLDG